MLFRDAPAAIRDEGIDALIVDQIEMAGGTVAEHLGLPFVSVAAALPINLDASVPPVNFPWSHRAGARGPAPEPAGERGQRVDLLGASCGRSTSSAGRGGFAPAGASTTLFSGLAQVAQLPAALELPGRRLPPRLPPHRPLDGRGRPGAGGLPLVAPRPGPAPGIRLDGDAPERGPPDLPDDRRGVRAGWTCNW